MDNDKTSMEIARDMARSSNYDDVRYLGKWNEYAVYEPIFNDNEERFIGFPQFILEKNGVMRWTNDSKESVAIMNKLL